MTIHEGSFGFDVGIAQIETATGRFLRANPRFCNLVGYSPQELERLDLQALTHPDDWEAGQVHRRRFVEGEIGEFEWVQRYRHKDGHCLRVKVAVSSLGSPGERPLSHIAVVQNITESNPAAAALWQRGEDFAHLLEVTRTLAMTLDLKRVLQAGSDGASRLLELGSAAIYLRDGEWLDLMAATPPLPPMLPDSFRRSSLADHPHIREALTTRRPVLLPDTVTADLAAPEREIAEALRLRTLLFLPLVAGEEALGTLIVGSVGAPRPISEAQIDLGCTLANLAALAVVNARLYEAGQRHVADLEREVADRKRAEAALRESEERLRLATDAAQMGVWERDLKSDRLVWSPMTERLNGFEQGTFPGTEEAFRALVHPDSLSAYMTARDRVRQGDGIFHAELHLRLRDGRDRWGLMSGRLIRDARGQPERIVGVDLDITERKRAEMERERLRAQLTQAQKMESV
ncbi:MAG: PAS domain S-box protein, partial [Nitrospira sp.]|nr:PAS domain S-box protein [Nitrospira sp.]